MFRNLSSLNIFELQRLRQDYEELGYATFEITSHLHKLYSFPVYLSIMSMFSAIIMLKHKKKQANDLSHHIWNFTFSHNLLLLLSI